MVRKSVLIIIFVLISISYAEEKTEVKDGESSKTDEKTISKRGIFHLGIHGHPAVPHIHASPVLPIVPKVPIVTKIPTVIKPIVPAVLPAPILPTTPYHITHGGATVTSLNVNYPRFPIFTKTFIPPALPILPTFPHVHHHHDLGHHFGGFFPHHDHHHLHPFFPHDHHHSHGFYPHVHLSKPIVPVAVPLPVPGIRHPKIPIFIPPKPVFVSPPKSDFIPIATPQPQPSFIPIPVPTNPHPTNPTIISLNPGISSTTSNHKNTDHTNIYPTTLQTPLKLLENQKNSQENWELIIIQAKPTQSSVTENCLPYNYHAALKDPTSSSSSNFQSTNNFVSGQGPSMAQQIALYQHQQQQQLLHDQHNSFPYPAAAETFSQNYEAASNDGNYHGLSSYQVPLGVH